MTAIIPTGRSTFRDALDRVTETPISRNDALLLISVQEREEFDSLLQTAANLRDRVRGRRVSFSKKVFIPLTNLCRDYCGYCTFRKDPAEPGARTMMPDEVIAVAEAGRNAGCKEALFSLGDRPEAMFPEMRDTLYRLGHRSTLSYLREMCKRVFEETGLLPHPNPGLMSRRDLESLRPYCPSMGLMLENVSNRLSNAGMPHENAPDKPAALRLKTIDEAGRLRIPFTTGILIGIGETLEERVDSLLAIRELNERHGHIQEVIIQNFRAKPDIPMRHHPEPGFVDFARTIAVARLILREINVQAPPNLSDNDYPDLLNAGINDWGGISPVTRDYINPEKPWPHLETLRSRTAAEGFELKERLCIYPDFVSRDEFLDPRAAARVREVADDSGYARQVNQ